MFFFFLSVCVPVRLETAPLADRASPAPPPVSLGKNQSSALETLCAQTEYLIDLASQTGGAAAFINLRDLFLRP